MIVTIMTLGSQAGTQGNVRSWGEGVGGPLSLGNEAQSIFPPSRTHTRARAHRNWPTLKTLRALNTVITTGY